MAALVSRLGWPYFAVDLGSVKKYNDSFHFDYIYCRLDAMFFNAIVHSINTKLINQTLINSNNNTNK